MINSPCKIFNIRFLHNAVFNKLRIAGNRSKGSFQLMGNIGGKFFAYGIDFFFLDIVFFNADQKRRYFIIIIYFQRIGQINLVDRHNDFAH